jgi:hypothetical protein
MRRYNMLQGELYYIIMEGQYGEEIVDEVHDFEEALRYSYEYELASGQPHSVKRADKTDEVLVSRWED